MTFVPAPGIVQVEIRALSDGQHIENRLHFNCNHTPTTTDLATINDFVGGTVLSDWLPNLPASVVMVENFLRSLETQNDIQMTGAYDVDTHGALSGQACANQNTLCVSLRSTSAGRSARGRLYWLGLDESQTTGNLIDTDPRIAIVGAVDTMRTVLLGQGFPWVIVSYINNGAPRVGGPVYFQVSTVLSVDNVLDSQRRRMPGRGT
jgi:hypothetical protein